MKYYLDKQNESMEYTISKFWFIGISLLFIIKLFKIKKKKYIIINFILIFKITEIFSNKIIGNI
jgi:hypothetical protein